MYPSDYGYSTGGGSGTYNRSWCLAGALNSWDSTSNSTPYKANCAETSWLYNSLITQWAITPGANADFAYRASFVSATGHIYVYNAYYSRGVRPVVYLKSNVVLKSGDGTQGESAYEFEVRSS